MISRLSVSCTSKLYRQVEVGVLRVVQSADGQSQDESLVEPSNDGVFIAVRGMSRKG